MYFVLFSLIRIFATSINNNDNMTKKLLLTFALLLTAVTGAWAYFTPIAGDVWDETTKTLTVNSDPGQQAYKESAEIQHLVIASGVTSIGEGVFASCDNMATVTFAAGSQLTTIGNGAFNYCTGLTSIEIPASVTSIGSGAFSECTGLATVSFAAGSQLKAIGDYAFSNSGLTSITIPASVTSISRYAFYGCSGLTTVSFAAGSQLESIGDCAFNYCTDLTSIEIPASVTSICFNAFWGCSSLATMTVEAGNTKYDSRNSCNAIIETSSNTLIAGCKGTTIPASVTSIGEDAFAYRTGLTSIEIPASVTSIGNDAFWGCSSLATVTVYTPDCTLGSNAFDYCDNLTIYVFSDLVESYQAAENWSDYASKITGITDLNGNCGTTDHESDVRWVLTGEDPYTLTIMKVGSTGDMKDYDDPDDQPWKDYRSSITKVVIGSGVTHIGDNAFTDVDAKFSAFVTKDNFYSYFNGFGYLLDNVFDELIFQGEFSDLVSYITLYRSITITGDNAVLNNIGFFISADVTLQNMKLVATSFLGNLINIACENAVISNMDISYTVDKAASAINVHPGANGTQILNNKIYFESTVDGYAVDKVTTAICVNSGVSIFDDEDPIEGLVINGNEITAVIPAFLADVDKHEYYVMGISAVNGVRINGAEDFTFKNNILNVTTNWLDRTPPTLQAMYVASSSGLIDKNTISMIDTFTPAGNDVYLYAVELVNDEELTISDNDFKISTTGGKEEAGTACAILAIDSNFSISDNTITTESKGPNYAVYFPSYMGAPCVAGITGNIIKVTGLATSAHDTGLVSGIEIETGDVEISGNTIYTYNIGEYAEDNYIYGISYAQGGVNSNWTITDNTIYTEGKYAISFKSADNAVITENALCAHELTGDAAVYIKEGSGNTVENNILGYVIPKTGERTYNIPAKVSSFKVYDDGGKGRIYSPGCDGTLTLTAPEGYRLQLSGNITTEKDVDYLSVYDGSSNLADVLINQVSSSASGELTAIPTVTSTGQSITFYFHSDNSDSDNSEFDGLDLTVTLVYTIDETTQNGGVVPDNVTTTTLTYTRTIPNSGDAWTVCLPYEPPTGDDLKYYTLESVSGTTLNFTEVTSPQAQTPYLVVASSDASVGTSAATVVNFSAEVQNPEAVDGYQFKGTLRGLDHDASEGKYILQSNNKWGIVLAEKTSVYIPPFRAYIESTSDARSLDSNLNDGTTGVDTIRTIDADGTEQWFDLSGRHIDKPTKKGLYIHNGKKEIVK